MIAPTWLLRGRGRGAVSLAAILVASAALGARAASEAALPGPATVPRPEVHERVAANRACEGCHQDVAAEWRGSLHHESWDDPIFLSAHALEPDPFCRGCHAPEADPAHAPPEAARRLGVGCVTCHLRGDEIVGVRSRPASAGVHAVRGDPRLGSPAACGGCHQFEFPEPQHAPMQGTLAEHRASPLSGATCQSCHMPRAAGPGGASRRHHGFRVMGNTALLRSAVRATAERADERSIDVHLAVTRAGHAVPTGDMFRRLEIRGDVEGDAGAKATPVVLGRRFRVVSGPQGPRRLQIGDGRLPASGQIRTVRLTFPGPIGDRPVRWEVVHQRMDGSMATSFGLEVARNETVLAEGRVPAGGLTRRGARAPSDPAPPD